MRWGQRGTTGVAAVILSILVTACSPAPGEGLATTGEKPAPAATSPSGPASPATSTAVTAPSRAPSASSTALPVGTVSARVAVAATALLAGTGGVWYLRVPGGGSAWVGRATAAGMAAERQVGPVPVGIATDGRVLFLAEGMPDGLPQPRSRVLEALDPTTLDVRMSTPVDDVIVDLRLDGARLWVLRADGVVERRDPATLDLIGQARTEGRGQGFLATWGGAAWSLQGERTSWDAGALLTRIDATTGSARVARRFPGLIARAIAAADAEAGWVGLGDLWVRGWAIRVDAAGNAGVPVGIGVATGLLVADDQLWWTSHDGHLGRVGAAAYAPLALQTASALAWVNGRVWVASQDLLVITPEP